MAGLASGVGGGSGGETASGGASRQSGGGPASNWMTLVTPADSPDEANLLSISTGDEVRTTSNQGLMNLEAFFGHFFGKSTQVNLAVFFSFSQILVAFLWFCLSNQIR